MSYIDKSKQDPTDDKLYENLTLNDFLRHFVPQEKTAREEADEINEKGYLPFIDTEIAGVNDVPAKTRTERRQLELKQRKADKKTKALTKRVAVMMNNPKVLKKAIEDPKIKEIAIKLSK